MRLFLKGRVTSVNASAEYDLKTGKFTVLKGSRVSEKITASPRFNGVNIIRSLRSQYVKDYITLQDVTFKSPSAAANFVTGNSTDGLLAWKDEKGEKLRKFVKK